MDNSHQPGRPDLRREYERIRESHTGGYTPEGGLL